MNIAPNLYTKRLRMRDITELDAPIIVRLRSNPEVYKYFLHPHEITVDEHLSWYNKIYAFDTNRFDWIAFDEENNAIGIFGIKRPYSQCLKAELSYILDPIYYGKGYAKEAMGKLIDYCRIEWKCTSVFVEIHKDNTASIEFIRKLGFYEDKTEGDFLYFQRLLDSGENNND